MPKRKLSKEKMLIKRRQMRKKKDRKVPYDMDTSDKAMMVRGY